MMSLDHDAEILRLRTALRDLVALSTIPAAWVGREPPAIAAGLADVLVGSLGLDFAFVRLCDPKGGAAVEVTRGNAWKAFPEWLQHHLAVVGQLSRKEIISDVGGAPSCRGIVIPIGVNAEGGLVAAACDRTNFPDEIDQLLLSVAANHAATAFQNARLIHERKRAEEELRQARNELEIKVVERTAELRESQEQWKAIFDNNPTMYFMVDAAGTILSVNPFGAEQLGYTIDELVGHSVLNVFYEADSAAVQRHAALCLEQLGRTMSWELRKVRKNGTMLWVRETAKAVLMKNRPVVLIVCEDITERKRAEEELRKTEQRLSTIIANTPIILFALDRSGVFTLSEGRGLDALGLKPGQVVGQSVFDVYRHVPQVLSNIRRALAGEPFTEVTEVNDLVFETHYVPFLDEQGEVAGVNGVAIDITERKRAEEALRQAQADLAHINRVTTMGELTASLAHEIKQPIAAAVTNANTCLRWLTRDQPDVEEARAAAMRIVKDATRAADIISRIRLLFKKGEPQRELVDVNDLIREMIVLLRNEATRYSIAIRTELAEDLPKALADRVQLQQVLMNLMLNGIDAMKDMNGAGELTIRSQQDGSGQLRISVSDTGVGLPPEQADQIFNAFFTTKVHGTGMGLPISRSIIESHGGRLWATANSGRGATFHFTLPSEMEAHA